MINQGLWSCRFFFISFFGCGALFGATIDGISQNLSAEDFKTREQATEDLYKSAVTDRKVIIQKVAHLRDTTKDPEVRFQTAKLLKRIYVRYELGVGGAKFGLSLGWFIDHNGKDVSSYPLVLEVEKGSPAAKAGFKPGDVITKLDGKSTRGHESRNDLVRKLATIKSGTEVKFSRKFNGLADPFKVYNKNKKGDLTVIPTVASEDQTIEVNKADFERWVNNSIRN